MPHLHRVVQGECLATIARKHRFADWRTIYCHPQNAAFRDKRPNPNLIYPGDEIYIPDLDSGERSAVTEQKHEYVLRWRPTTIRIDIEDDKGVPFAGQEYRL